MSVTPKFEESYDVPPPGILIIFVKNLHYFESLRDGGERGGWGVVKG